MISGQPHKRMIVHKTEGKGPGEKNWSGEVKHVKHSFLSAECECRAGLCEKRCNVYAHASDNRLDFFFADRIFSAGTIIFL